MNALFCLLYLLAGVLIGTLMSLMPSLHIYNVAGLALIMWEVSEKLIPYEFIPVFFMSMIVAFAFVNTIPMTFIGAPDESATVTILPGAKYLSVGRGYEAAVMTGLGSLGGVLLLLILTPLFFWLLPTIHTIVSPHLHWILGLIIVYMLMSEWPKGSGIGDTVLKRFLQAWGNLFAGLLTFALAGFLGMIITTKSFISHDMGFQNIMPVFVGLFAMPSIIQNLLSREKVPPQYVPQSIDLEWTTVGKSLFQGAVGGLLAAFIPVVTAGIGGIIAGHATAQRGDRIFIVSGGVAKVIYYVGSFLFLFIITPLTPDGIGKGGLSLILKPVFSPNPGDYALMISVIVFAGFLSMLLLLIGARWTITLLEHVDYRYIYVVAGVIILSLVIGLTGLPGLLLMATSSCIGSIPVFFHCRRSNCMAVLLVPIMLNMAGYGAGLIDFLGLG